MIYFVNFDGKSAWPIFDYCSGSRMSNFDLCACHLLWLMLWALNFWLVTVHSVVECFYSFKPEKETKKYIWLLARACRPRSKFHKLWMPYTGNLDFQNLTRLGSWLTPCGPGVRKRLGAFIVLKLLMPYAGNAISRFQEDLNPGWRLSALEFAISRFRWDSVPGWRLSAPE